MKVGVLALQGDFEAHAHILRTAGAEPVEVRTPDDLASVDALIVPGGESTTIRKLAEKHGLIGPVRGRVQSGMPLFGTCAGMIVCANRIVDGDAPVFSLIDIAVRRNAYGRQVNSFEADLEWKGIGPVHAVFIRAPWVEEIGTGVEVLAEHSGRPVAVRQGKVLVAAFHPELTGDAGVHRAFLEMI
jgi:pyridoxal 5'-phosphate synthase pdxT subunit